MQNHWQTFFNNIGLSLDPHYHCSLATSSNEVLPETNTISPLSHYGLLTIAGEDAAKFIQGQASCDIREVDGRQARWGCYSTPKGRVFSNFLAAQLSENHYCLRHTQDTLSHTQQTLSKYLAFFKAEQTDSTYDFILLGLKGSQAALNIATLFGCKPTAMLATVSNEHATAIQLDETGDIFECWIAVEAIEQLWPLISNGLTVTGSHYWQLQTIRQGHANISAATQELFIPQMLNYQHTGAISFTKGCFTGQEIIARMHYKGKLKRQMYHLEMPNSATLAAAAELFSQDKPQSVGNIVNISYNKSGNAEALAVLTTDAAEQKSLYIRNNQQLCPLAITLHTLPYAEEKK